MSKKRLVGKVTLDYPGIEIGVLLGSGTLSAPDQGEISLCYLWTLVGHPWAQASEESFRAVPAGNLMFFLLSLRAVV